MSKRSSSLYATAFLMLVATGAAVAAEPAATGIHFTANQKVDGLPGVPATSVAIEGWAAAGNVRIEMADGNFVLVRDAGKNLYFCNPKEKSYWRMDQQAGLRSIGATLGVHDPKLEKLLDEDGGKILGQPTRHTRYRISYTTGATLPGMPPMDSTMEKEVWSAPGLPEASFDAWLGTGEIPTGDPAFGKLLAGMRETMKGLPLHVRVVNTMTMKMPDGKAEESQGVRLEVEMKSLETVGVDASRFAIPEGYKENASPLAPTAPGTGG